MTSHAESARSAARRPPAASPKLHVLRSPSKESVAVRFLALGKEDEDEEDEEEEEELCTTSVVTASEASEEAVGVGERRVPTSNSSPTKSSSFPSGDKPFLSLLKSFSSDAESRDGTAPSIRHRHLKSLVKSLSSDGSQDSSSVSYRFPESRLNLQLFKQFTQSRTASAASDSKTAPSSPLTSHENRGFFNVSEVEARIEDTRRRLSEAIAEPLQLLTKMIDDKKNGGAHRPKSLSASAAELSVHGHPESNNNDCIEEEEEDGGAAESPGDAKSPDRSSLLHSCSMSALAKQEYDDFCILYSEDFETGAEADGAGRTDDAGGRAPPAGGPEPVREEASGGPEPAPSVPLRTLLLLTGLVYGCLVLPLPSYVGGVLLGVGLGFLLAIGAVWLSGPRPSGGSLRRSRLHRDLTRLDIKEPEIYKVSERLKGLGV